MKSRGSRGEIRTYRGKINWAQIDLKKDDQDHLISPEERFKIPMAGQ